MNLKRRNIVDLVAPIVEGEGYFLIDVILRGNPQNQIIEIYIDNETGVKTDDCAVISRKINEKFEDEELIESKYRLDVSSPGVERPLKFIEQYHKHVNRDFELKFKQEEKSKKIKAKLVRVDKDELTFQKGKDEFVLLFDEILSAKVLISF